MSAVLLPGKAALASKYKQHQALGVWRCEVYNPSGKEVYGQAKTPSAGEMCDHVYAGVLLWVHVVILTNGRKLLVFFSGTDGYKDFSGSTRWLSG